MAIQLLRDQKLWFSGHDLTGVMNAMALNYGAEMLDATVFGNKTRRRLAGLKTVRVNHQGYFDVDAVDAALQTNIGIADQPMSFASGAVEGDVAYTFRSALSQYRPQAQVGNLLRFSVTGAATGDLIRGRLLAQQSGIDASGNVAGQNIGAVAAGKSVFASLHVLSVADPGDTLDITIESDADGDFAAGATTRLTFAQASATGAEWQSAPGAITDAHWRVAYSVAGSAPSFDFVVVMGIQ